MTGQNIAAIVLAAGTSSRFGEKNKLLADWRNKPIILRVIENIERAGIDSIIVVTGPAADQARVVLAGKPAAFVDNARFETGIASSIITGINTLSSNVEAALIVLGDMPMVAPATIQKLVRSFETQTEKLIAVPVHKGRRGNPVLWRRGMFEALLTITGDAGGKQVIKQHPAVVADVPVDDPGILFDIDTKQALDRA